MFKRIFAVSESTGEESIHDQDFLSPLFNFQYQMRISSELTTVEREGEEKLHRISGLEHDYVAIQCRTEMTVDINWSSLWDITVWAADADGEKKWQICTKYNHLMSNENLIINSIIFNVEIDLMQCLRNKSVLGQMYVDSIIKSIFYTKCFINFHYPSCEKFKQ